MILCMPKDYKNRTKIDICDYLHLKLGIINTYSMKQPDLYYFETIKITSQA